MWYWYELVVMYFATFIVMHCINFDALQGDSIMLHCTKYFTGKRDKK
jgi:hypothetical protein